MINPIAFRIGSLTIHWYGLIISFALLLGFSLVIYRSKNTEIPTEFFLDFFIIGIPVSLIAARLYYVIFNFDYYIRYPLEIIAIWKGGIAIHGAVIGGLIVLILLTKKRQLSFLKVVDIIAPALILGQAIGRWGNFINQEAYGGVVSGQFINKFPELIKNQMYIEGSFRHPTFLYESIWNLFIFGILIWLSKKDFIKDGDLFFGYLIGYSIGRFFIEGLRTDSLMFLNIQVAQLVSILLILFGSIMIFVRHKSD
ncbi:MAG: prolipoprotein diacylglyceryl transferase [Bacillota bacterium]